MAPKKEGPDNREPGRSAENDAHSLTPGVPAVHDKTGPAAPGDDWTPPAGLVVPGVIGAGQLAPRHREQLEASGISPDAAFARGYRTVTAEEAIGFNFSRKQAGAGLLVPLWSVSGEVAGFQLRRDSPRKSKRGPVKYETPEGAHLVVDCHPAAQPFLRRVSVPLWITEGTKKSDSALSQGAQCVVSISGVWAWRGRGNDGESAALPCWEQIALKDKDDSRCVCLAFDSDVVEKEPVRNALARLKRLLESRGAEVLIVRLEPLEGGAKCGLDDYLARGGTLEALVEAASPDLPPPKEKPAFSNFKAVRSERGVSYFAKTLVDIRRELFELTDLWPRAWREDLFIDVGGELRFVRGIDDLAALIRLFCDRAERAYAWKKRDLDSALRSFVTEGELVASLRLDNRRYEDVVEIPLEPLPPGTYVTQKVNVEQFPDAKGNRLRELLSFFEPASVADEALLQALALTPFWGGTPGARPFFIVTGPGGVGAQETGKTSLVEKVAKLSGGVFRLSTEKNADAIVKQLVTDPAMRRRVALLDNLDETLFSSRELAELITADEIHGRAAFERQRSRPNRITWCATAVSPCLSPDLASRAVILHLSAPDREGNPGWSETIDKFIAENRAELIADALALLRGERWTIEGDPGRFPSWTRKVLACHAGVNLALEAQRERVHIVDHELENLELLLEEVERQGPGFYGSKQLADMWERAIGRKVTATWVSRRLKGLERRGKLPPGITEQRTRAYKGWYFHREALDASLRRDPERALP